MLVDEDLRLKDQEFPRQMKLEVSPLQLALQNKASGETPTAVFRERVLNLYRYHQYKGDKFFTDKLRRDHFEKMKPFRAS